MYSIFESAAPGMDTPRIDHPGDIPEIEQLPAVDSQQVIGAIARDGAYTHGQVVDFLFHLADRDQGITHTFARDLAISAGLRGRE